MLKLFSHLGADIRILPHPTEPREGSSTSASHWSPRPCSADQIKPHKTSQKPSTPVQNTQKSS